MGFTMPRYLAILVVVLLGCSSPGAFVPAPGAFLGDFAVNQVAIGDLSFTANSQGLAGTGVLVDGELEIPVAISANLNGSRITGSVTNTNLGTGQFRGSFNGAAAAAGSFTFEVITGTELSGSWSALAN